MRIKTSLLSLLQFQLLPVTLVLLPVGALYVLWVHEPLDARDPWLALLILVHSIALVARQGGPRTRRFAFLYTRGYSRDTLWWHTMLSSLLGILWIWLPLALIVWLPIRSTIQDKVFVSPYFPLFRIKEASVPFVWLGFYALLVPMFHYVWIRRAQPTRGGDGSVLLAIGLVIVGATFLNFRWHPDWFKVVMVIASAILSVTALIGGFLLHRTLEVRS